MDLNGLQGQPTAGKGPAWEAEVRDQWDAEADQVEVGSLTEDNHGDDHPGWLSGSTALKYDAKEKALAQEEGLGCASSAVGVTNSVQQLTLSGSGTSSPSGAVAGIVKILQVSPDFSVAGAGHDLTLEAHESATLVTKQQEGAGQCSISVLERKAPSHAGEESLADTEPGGADGKAGSQDLSALGTQTHHKGILKVERDDTGVCAICHNIIRLADTAYIKGCEHPYCANCILQWCSYKSYPWCPQCRTPFTSLVLFKLLDGSLSDALVEESVCLLLRAPWYVPVELPDVVDAEDELVLEEEDEYDDEYYRGSLRLGNRRWGENGYVRGGRMQARVSTSQGGGTPGPSGRRGSAEGSSSRVSPGSSAAKGGTSPACGGMGRRAKRAQKREEADKETSAAGSNRQHGKASQRQMDRRSLNVA